MENVRREETIQQKGLLERVFTAVEWMERKTEAGHDLLTFSASSEAPVERWWGTEVLSHDPSAVDLSRAEAGAMPFLFNHNSNDPIGMIVGARVAKGKLTVDASMFKTARAQEIKTMMDGGLRNVSIRYQIDTIEEDVKTEVFTATRWMPHEVSIAPVPADYSVGLGRNVEGVEYAVRKISYKPEAELPVITRGLNMAIETEVKPEVKVGAVEAEKERRQAILHLCQSNKIDARVEARWVEDGTPLTLVAKEILDVMEERGRQKPLMAARLGLTNKETQNFSLFRAIRALRFGAQQPELMQEAAFELECSRAIAKQLGRAKSSSILIPSEILQRPLSPEAVQRAMSTIPGSKGGYMVDVNNMGFIDILRNRSVAMAMGARVLGGLQGNVTFSRQTGKPSITWQAGEGAAVTAADQTLGQLSMTPKTCIAITDVSEQLLAQASPSAESFVMADLASDVAIDGIDAAVINGTGGAQPIGIKNTAGITSGQDSATVTYAKLLAFISTAGAANAIRGNPGWVTNTAGAAILMQKQRFTSTDTPVWAGNMLDGNLVGFRAMSSEQMASGNLLFGSWDEVIIGEWGVLELSTDNGGTRFNAAQVGIRAMWMVDVMLRYPQSFVASVNLSA